jgi:beta-lactamase superfamily II metal-dependent hydrolase
MASRIRQLSKVVFFKSVLASLFTILVFANSSKASDQTLEDVLSMEVVVHFIDVGVGDAVLIELSNREHEVIIDGGDRTKGYNFLDYAEEYINDPVELAVITHPDYDHWSGIKRLVTSQYSVTELWDPGFDRDCKFSGSGGAEKKKRDRYLKFIRGLPQSILLRRPISANPSIPLFSVDGTELYVLYADANPQEGDCSYKINNASIVIRMVYKDVVFLFTGDANGKERHERGSVKPKYVEANLLKLQESNPGILQAHVLKVPHHGSETANTTAFIKAVSPRFAVISSSVTTHYLLPKKRVLQRYQRIRFKQNNRIEKVLRTNYGEKNYETRKFGDDHIVCGTNGHPGDLICDYIWNFKEE